MPTTEDVNKAREQAAQMLGDAVEQARTPLLAALGAGDLAAHALLDTLNKIREQAESARSDLNDLSGDPAELRKRVDSYLQSATQLYDYLADRGERALDRLRAQPPVKVAEERAEKVAEDVRDIGDDVLGNTEQTSRAAKNGKTATKSKQTKSRTQ